MPPKAKQPANGKSEAKPKPTAPAPATTASEGSKPATTSITKPDATAHHAEQDALKKEIDQYQAKLVSGRKRKVFILPRRTNRPC